MKRFIFTPHDEKIVADIKEALDRVMREADEPIVTMKRIASMAVSRRNKGMVKAKKRPFHGICEATGNPLKDVDKVLDEVEPEKGYAGEVRWICPKCNNSGRRSCG